MRICLFVSSLVTGGSQRVVTLMANHWAAVGNQVTILTLSGRDDDYFPLDARVRRVGLGLLQPSRSVLQLTGNTLRRLLQVRRAIRQTRPSVVISFVDQANMLVLLATHGLPLPVIVSERIDPRWYPLGRVWALLRRATYPRAAAVVVQTRAVQEWARAFVPASRVQVIPNPVPAVAAGHRPRADRGAEERLLIGLGRLQHQKGFDLLLRAFARNVGRHPNWRLLLLGDGPERAALERAAQRLGIADRVRLAGGVSNPAEFLRGADLFVFPSRFEGFPNALLEAMACGLPVISFDCPSGPGEIIHHGVDGLLIPPEDVAALGQAMDRLMSDAPARARLGLAATGVAERFSVPRVMQQWEQVIARASARR